MSDPIRLKDAAKYYNEEPHQEQAWDWLQDRLTAKELEGFQKMFRNEVPKRPGSKTDDVPAQVQGICTPELMEKLTKYPASSFDAVFCNDCNRLFADTGFDKHLDAMQMLMANMMHETCNFIYLKELASGVAYNNRSDLGNGPNDGPVYKGAGVLQLTGKFNYQRLADGINDQKVMEGVDYVADTYPFTSARIWIQENDLLNVCLKQGFDACCVRINGGYNGYEDRLAKYRICQNFMK